MVEDGLAHTPVAGAPVKQQVVSDGQRPAAMNSTGVFSETPPPNELQPLLSATGPQLVQVNFTSAAIDSTASSNGSGTANAAGGLHRTPLSTIFPASRESVKMPLMNQDKFRWDQKEQGHILGAFFFGYILFQIPGARMAEVAGAKWIIMAANAGSALVSLIFPLSTQLNSIHLLMALRFVMGLCQSAFFPAAYVLFCRWLPERERSILLPVMFIGSNMGSISTYILSSYLISASYGWPSIFHLSGGVCALASALWWVFGANGPEDSWLITDEEQMYIKANVDNQSSETNSLRGADEMDHQEADGEAAEKRRHMKQVVVVAASKIYNKSKLKLEEPILELAKLQPASPSSTTTNCNHLQQPLVETQQQQQQQKLVAANGYMTDHHETSMPMKMSWHKLLRSVPVWTLILSMYGNEWSNVVLCYELPTYLNAALSFPIEQNGVINSFFQLSYTLFSPLMSAAGAYMLDRRPFGAHKIHVRKLFQSLATFGQLLCFVSVPICGANRGLIIMFMFSAVVFKTCANAGDIMVPGDLSPEYAGTIFACANSIGNTAGFFVPLAVGWLVRDAHVRTQWTSFWMTSAAIMGFSGIIFLTFGETSRQDLEEPDLELAAARQAAAEERNLRRSRANSLTTAPSPTQTAAVATA